MPNLFAYGMILIWPFISLIFYRNFNTVIATTLTFLGAFLLLPVKTSFDFPLVPEIGKDEVASISALIGCVLIKKKKIHLFGSTTLIKGFIGILLIIPLINVYFNLEPMFNGREWVKGITLFDSISQLMAQYLDLLPFIILSQIIRSYVDLILVVKLLVSASLLYSPLIFIELQLSPQLHNWLYGFFPHSFGQHVRLDGFRPVVFIGHGLWVSIFYAICFALSVLLWRIKAFPNSLLSILTPIFLFLILISTKSFGPLILGTGLSILIIFCTISINKQISKLVALVFFSYPLLSILETVPYDEIVGQVRQVSHDRAQSLETRFLNEKVLIEHANEKSLIGWGSWGRNRFYNSITDGYWLIVFGQYGAIYFLFYFLLFSSPIWRRSNNKFVHLKERTISSSVLLVLSVVLIDQIPNSSLQSNWLWLLSGAVSGVLNAEVRKRGDNKNPLEIEGKKG